MKKRFFMAWMLLVVATLSVWSQQAKYVFYFIGDGMGVNQVNGTEAYRAELEGRIGITPLLFTQFPYATMATTYSANSKITDSAASGTALATGYKTNNGTLGLLPDQKTAVNSIAVKAQQAGARVGIATSVSIDHATPAAFYAHVPSRNSSYEIGQQLISTGFDFYAGSDFVRPTNRKALEEGTLYEQSEKAGYTIVRSYKEYQRKARKADKIILFQSEEASKRDRGSIPYAIDREKGDLSLTEITRAGINFLSKELSKGFFLMVEGGKIDYAGHANDAATTFAEVEDFDNAIRVAYEFYEQHPDETLIVVTADHETGGIVLGTGKYDLNLQALKYQRMSVNKLSAKLNELRKKTNNKVTWEMAQQLLGEHFGLGNPLKLNKQQESRLRKAYDDNFKDQETAYDESMYQKDERLATVAKEIINEIAMVGWMSGSHSNGYVPVYAIGAGAEKFCHRTDNAELPMKIAEAAGWE
ncbi:MAG: alkaline phosphatase [Bacteroidaceae bacterium]|nr:alkaline phosphatase [Bacteroidaceae bacterium]MBQ8501270.1 alkaline phosphatase [Bacteroides sp.]